MGMNSKQSVHGQSDGGDFWRCFGLDLHVGEKAGRRVTGEEKGRDVEGME